MGNKLRYEDIELFTKDGSYETDHNIDWIFEEFLSRMKKRGYNVQLQPDFQRPIVWDNDRCTAFLEYFIKGGRSGRVIYFNCSDWGDYSNPNDDFVCVDGQQRLEAIRKFVNKEIKVFDRYYDEFSEGFFSRCPSMKININNLKTKKEVLKWYLGINSGGVPHTKEEIERVNKMIEDED